MLRVARRAWERAKPTSRGIRAFASLPSDFDVLPGDVQPGERPAIINAYDESGFTVGGLDYAGPIICLGKQLALLWTAVEKPEDITPDSLSVFELARPRPELLLLGTGRAPAGHAIPADTRKYLADLGIKVDVLSTRHAAATHNFLSEEGRSVATALLLHET